MAGKEPGTFDRAAFVAAVKKAMAAEPKNLEEADDFKEGGADQLKTEVVGQVGAGKQAAAKDIEARRSRRTRRSPRRSRSRRWPEETKAATPSYGRAHRRCRAGPAGRPTLSGAAANEQTDGRGRRLRVGPQEVQRADDDGGCRCEEGRRGARAEAPRRSASRSRPRSATPRRRPPAGARATSRPCSPRGAALDKVRKGKDDAKAKDEQKRAEVTRNVTSIFDKTKTETDAQRPRRQGLSAFEQGEAAAKQAFKH